MNTTNGSPKKGILDVGTITTSKWTIPRGQARNIAATIKWLSTTAAPRRTGHRQVVKITCDKCKTEVPPSRVAITGTALAATCPGCETQFQLQLGEPAPKATSPSNQITSCPDKTDAPPNTTRGQQQTEANPHRCPKCEVPVPKTADACPRCGLLRSHFDDFHDQQKQNAPPQLKRMWDEIQNSWSDTQLHDRFIELAMDAEAYTFAARCYRQASHQPGAEDFLARILRVAEIKLLTKANTTQTEAPAPFQKVVVMLVVLLALGGLGGVYALYKEINKPQIYEQPSTIVGPGIPKRPATPSK